MHLDKSIPVPLYYQLAERLREKIEAHELQAGDQIPSERELGEQFGISRMTARQAITYLARKGTLVIKPGVGTFVAEPKLAYDALHLLGFTEEMMAQGRVVTSQVLEQLTVAPPPVVARRLDMAENARALKIVRLRLEENVPLLLETIYLPAHLCSGLEKQNLEVKSLYALLEQRYRLKLKRSHQTLEATTANDYESHLFGIEPNTPMILSEGVTFTDQDVPVEYFKAVYRGDRFKFELESQRSLWSGESSAAPRISVVFATEKV